MGYNSLNNSSVYTALPDLYSRPSTRSKDSTYSQDSSVPTLVSVSSHESGDSGYSGRLNVPFYAKCGSAGHRSAASSTYDVSISESEGGQKENIRPTSRSRSKENQSVEEKKTSNCPIENAIPILRRACSTLKTTPVQPEKAQPKPDVYQDTFGTSACGQQFGVQVSIVGGPEKPKKSTLAERAAKFGKVAFPDMKWKGPSNSRARAASEKQESKTPSLYTAVKSTKDMSQAGPRSYASSTETLSRFGVVEHLKYGAHIPVMPGSSTSVNTIAPTAPLNITKPKTPTLVERDRSVSLPTRTPVTERADEARPIETPPIEKSSDTFKSVLDVEIPAPHFEQFECRKSTDSADSDRTLEGNAAQEPQETQESQERRSHFSWSTYAESDTDSEDQRSTFRMYPEKPQYPEEEAVSRFSWTTVNTDSTYQQEGSSCSASPQSEGPPTPIMTRRRPLPSKASMYSLRDREPQASSPVSATDKALPMPPTLSQELSRLDALQAKYDDLEIRQINIHRIILELEKLEKASPLEVTEKMRRENRKKLEGVRQTLDEVQREKHELGTALSRARGRAQREKGEDSALWLRRVTE
ncbi:hypothetical protein AAFC00_005919 [Neodothiora populina]|uniref:BMERB domain-containing protein n=1 Tax=Neodothiora populina TaxID=2781224 RepID=A0ABR3P6B3_9PEZI